MASNGLGGSDGRIRLQCGRPQFNPWVGKMPWRREWLLIPVFLPGEFHRQGTLRATVHGVPESNTAEGRTHIHENTRF